MHHVCLILVQLTWPCHLACVSILSLHRGRPESKSPSAVVAAKRCCLWYWPSAETPGKTATVHFVIGRCLLQITTDNCTAFVGINTPHKVHRCPSSSSDLHTQRGHQRQLGATSPAHIPTAPFPHSVFCMAMTPDTAWHHNYELDHMDSSSKEYHSEKSCFSSTPEKTELQNWSTQQVVDHVSYIATSKRHFTFTLVTLRQ